MTTDDHGRLSWICPCGIEPDRNEQTLGERPDGTFCLPESAIRQVRRCGILNATNHRFDTMLDLFEADEVVSQSCLAFLAGQLDQAFRDHEHEHLIRQDLVPFLLGAASQGRCLTFDLAG